MFQFFVLLALGGIASSSASAAQVTASATASNAYYEVGSDSTRELAVSAFDRIAPMGAPTEEVPGTEVDQASVIFDKLVLLGQKFWKLVEGGKPIANFSSQRADVLPQGIEKWQDLSGWQVPVSKRFERVIQNKLGINVVTFRYRVIYNWGGSVNGKGAYLMGVTVYPEVINVAWGWNLDAQVTIPTISNAGTSENPKAGVELLISSKVRTPMTLIDNSESYYVRGDGLFANLQE
ncbi:MAG: hypothetical protein RJB38_620 [Pseudomonadota bacterium]|jgi:hypothetical protein